MNCLTHADTNGNTLLQRAEEGQDSVGFLKKLYLYTNISFRDRRVILCHLLPYVKLYLMIAFSMKQAVIHMAI